MPSESVAATDPRYPVGPFREPASYSAEGRARFIDEIAALPAALRGAVGSLSAGQLEEPYRPGGWTVRQLAHHVADSHMNAYVRFKLALTEDAPTIKPYEEARWAELPDTRETPVEVSLALLDALHARWVALLRAMSPADFERVYVHPELGRRIPLDYATAMYAWHCRHHLAHVTELRKRQGW